jgi:hypothetical protein
MGRKDSKQSDSKKRLLASRAAQDELRKWRGKIRLDIDLTELRKDRREPPYWFPPPRKSPR